MAFSPHLAPGAPNAWFAGHGMLMGIIAGRAVRSNGGWHGRQSNRIKINVNSYSMG
jgi:hypothetical protein